jgi:hypothetical protein
MLQLSPEEKMRRWPVVDVGSTERVYAKIVLEGYVFWRARGECTCRWFSFLVKTAKANLQGGLRSLNCNYPVADKNNS